MWITTLGGPFLILPDAVVADWPGAGDATSGELGPEYAGICDVASAFAVIEFAANTGIVIPALWDDEAPTTLLAHGTRDAYVVRAMLGARADPADEVFVGELSHAFAVAPDPAELQASLSFRGGHLRLFDSAWSGDEVIVDSSPPETGSVQIELEPGDYELMCREVVVRESEYWCLRLGKRA